MQKIYTFLFVLLMVIATPAYAQESPFTGGMKHSRVYNSNKPMVTSQEQAVSPESEKKNRIWNKYKSLAAGTEDPTADAPKDGIKEIKEITPAGVKEIAPIKTIKPNEQAAEKVKPSGMGILIQKYQQNKAQRKDLRSLSFERPKDLEPQTKTIELQQEDPQE